MAISSAHFEKNHCNYTVGKRSRKNVTSWHDVTQLLNLFQFVKCVRKAILLCFHARFGCWVKNIIGFVFSWWNHAITWRHYHDIPAWRYRSVFWKMYVRLKYWSRNVSHTIWNEIVNGIYFCHNLMLNRTKLHTPNLHNVWFSTGYCPFASEKYALQILGQWIQPSCATPCLEWGNWYLYVMAQVKI